MITRIRDRFPDDYASQRMGATKGVSLNFVYVGQANVHKAERR